MSEQKWKLVPTLVTSEIDSALLSVIKPGVFSTQDVLDAILGAGPHAIRLTKGELLELYEGYTGNALIELVYRAHVASFQAEVERLRSALKFYADREHYHFESGNWDTVSGEPLNILWNGEEPDFIEDGTVARNALGKGAKS